MDVGLSRDPAESFRIFQSHVLDLYEELVEEYGLEAVDATGDINSQQVLVRRMARRVLSDYRGTGADLAAAG
jgi:dTMP kinase